MPQMGTRVGRRWRSPCVWDPVAQRPWEGAELPLHHPAREISPDDPMVLAGGCWTVTV